ncbi:MAG: nicotinate-nucleotide--dimethylbenzimidazole phosphoribosyltransferase [Cellvibrionaceae bacterium]|nr:nicotinate-nucleotide--dimethylbenzimidazole phosphoribosyltransferase [Cellvibrionaceae bacterium]
MATPELHWLETSAPPPCEQSQNLAAARQQQLTKPTGSLGKLEQLAIKFSAWQRREKPEINQINIRVFAADHGVCAQGISAFPQAVTVQMVENFVRGGAAISVLARQLKADFKVVNVGLAGELIQARGLQDLPIARGTQDLSQGPAMSLEQCARALDIGRQFSGDCDIQLGGEMGIGNTTSASALVSALLKLPAQQTVGPGTGLDAEKMSHKRQVVEQALAVNIEGQESPLQILYKLGGFEIAALVGSYIACAQQGIPALVDGFISSAAALCAVQINPSVDKYLLFSHRSAEPAHHLLLEAMGATPLLDLGMRLGEGSGAAVALPIIQSAVSLHCKMATFAEAGVSS